MNKRSSSRHGHLNFRVATGLILSSIGVSMALLALSINSSSTAAAASGKFNNGVTVIRAYHHDVSPAMRDVEAWPVQLRQEHEAAENPKINTGQHKDSPDLVIQKGTLLHQLAPSIPDPILDFAGIPYPGVSCFCAPPDTNGYVGATQYVQIVNEGYQVFNKDTGASELGPNSISSVFSGFGGVCQTSGFGDPVVLYDHLAQRWVITQFAGSSIPTDECVAVSTTSDATGSYNRYGFHIGNNFFDYPKLSVWPDAYYMSANIFSGTTFAYLGPQAYAMDRAKMVAGDPSATIIIMPVLGPTFPPLLPGDLDGQTLPPAGAPNPFLLLPDTGTYRVYHFHADFANPASSTFALFGTSPAAGYNDLCPTTRSCVPELGQSSANWLDGIGDRLMSRLVYRNFGDHDSLLSNFSVNANGNAGVRWFELRGSINGPVTTYQESTYAPDTDWRWMGSIAMDGQGNIALGYSASSPTIFPQIRYTGRLAADPINMMTLGEGHIIDGTGAQTGTSNRWGDYSSMTVDPVDDSTFWYTQEYYDSTSSFNWRTRIGSFKLASGGGGGANLVSAASRLTHASAGTFDVNMPLTGNPGVEDRDSGGSYLAVFTFDTAVTSGNATVTNGTGTAGTPSFNGNEMLVPLSGVADQQVLTIEVSGVNGGSTTSDVEFGFLIADIDGNGTVGLSDKAEIVANKNQPVNSSNFRSDINLSGVVDKADASEVKANRRHSLP